MNFPVNTDGADQSALEDRTPAPEGLPMDARLPPDFVATVLDRMTAAGVPPAYRREALAVLALVSATLATLSLATRETAPDLAARLDMPPAKFLTVMRLLSSVGAVTPRDTSRGTSDLPHAAGHAADRGPAPVSRAA
jgi:hypothetical protein